MIDLHCHLLPGVDDGPPDLATALRMLEVARRDGSTALVATPHLRHAQWWNSGRHRLEALRAELREAAGGDPELHLGGEIAVGSQSLEEMLELPGGDLLTLAGSRYVLLELGPDPYGPDPAEVVHELRIHDLEPILAHPERISWLAAGPGLLERLVDGGAHLQLTAMSLTGELGRGLERISAGLMDANLVTFVASDAHDASSRPPILSSAYRRVRDRWGEERAQALFRRHPRAVLENRALPAPATAGR